ncbi:MAG: nitrous-oxide reductase, partial [Acidobacteria bacterium]|nr:nitrous-oxide reductase [Acidobacteriota bacterium]
MRKKIYLLTALVSIMVSIVSLSCNRGRQDQAAEQAAAALQVYVPVGKLDKYYAFLSGGQSGSVFIYGLPSGRLIRSIPVFEPRAAYGYANVAGTPEYERLKATGGFWGDTHHPVLSETHGDYDGRWLWINDKANGRVARIDLSRFETAAMARIP